MATARQNTTAILHNRAAWIPGPHARFEVKEAPYPSPGEGQVIVRNACIAINPLEVNIQDNNPQIGGKEIEYPTILGADLAGIVVEVGENVTDLKLGDHVIANATGAQTGRPSMSAFQLFSQIAASSAIPVPEQTPLEAAVALSLACDTAIAGLFVPEQLGLSLPGFDDDTLESIRPPQSVLLVWGGSSSVGCCVIQFARAAGYEVYAVASRRNHDLCRRLGASKTFDYADAAIESSILAELDGKTVVGAYDCIADAEKTTPALARILAYAKGNRKITTVLTPPVTQFDGNVGVIRVSIPAMAGTRIYAESHAWMAKALARGTLQPMPEACVIGDGLELIQEGVDRVRRGVSAAKIVVRL